MLVVNVEGAIYKENKWLIIERSLKEEHAGGILSFVGGTVEEEGDTSDLLERTLKREIYEEVGIYIKDEVQYVRNTSFTTPSGNVVINVVFLCEHASGEPYLKSPDEVESVQWMTKDEIVEHEKTPVWLKENIEFASKKRGE